MVRNCSEAGFTDTGPRRFVFRTSSADGTIDFMALPLSALCPRGLDGLDGFACFASSCGERDETIAVGVCPPSSVSPGPSAAIANAVPVVAAKPGHSLRIRRTGYLFATCRASSRTSLLEQRGGSHSLTRTYLPRLHVLPCHASRAALNTPAASGSGRLAERFLSFFYSTRLTLWAFCVARRRPSICEGQRWREECLRTAEIPRAVL